ncbi:MAG TPA: hypothetical protein VFZ15_08750 [Acidimicrobiia bacterium]|nr:hypothetical protein [Acidimicrobiia bacterium]
MNRPELRPYAVGEIIDAAIRLVTGNARALFTISALIFIPLGALQVLAYSAVGGSDLLSLVNSLVVESALDEQQIDRLIDAMQRLLSLGLLLALLAGVGTAVMQAATAKTATDLHRGIIPSWRDSIGFGLGRPFALLGAVILVGLGSSIGLILCLVPGIWLFASWSVTVPALVVERRGPIQAMQRSFQLAKGRLGPVLVVVLISSLVYGTVSYTFSLLASVLTFAGQSGDLPMSVAASVISSTVSSILVQPFIAAATIVLYLDLRVRAEDYDLQKMKTEIGDDSSPPTPS